MNTIHIYEFDAENIILAARAARSFDLNDEQPKDTLYDYGGILVFCWRTKSGNISVRLIK